MLRIYNVPQDAFESSDESEESEDSGDEGGRSVYTLFTPSQSVIIITVEPPNKRQFCPL